MALGTWAGGDDKLKVLEQRDAAYVATFAPLWKADQAAVKAMIAK